MNNLDKEHQEKLNKELSSEVYSSFKTGDTTEIAKLLDNGADIETKSINNETMIESTLWRIGNADNNIHINALNTFKFLVGRGANVNGKDKQGETYLSMHSRCYHQEAVKFLIDAGADVNVVNDDGTTPLINAVLNNCDEITRTLLDAGANYNYALEYMTKNKPNGRSDRSFEYTGDVSDDLMTAAYCCNLSASILLLKAGADVNSIDADNGKTALSYALDNHFLNKKEMRTDAQAIAKILIDEGSKISNGDLLLSMRQRYTHVWNGEDDETTLLNNDEDFYKHLIKLGANVNEADENGFTVLMFSANGGDINAVKELLNAGADINIEDNQGKTALDYATVDVANFIRVYTENQSLNVLIEDTHENGGFYDLFSTPAQHGNIIE